MPLTATAIDHTALGVIFAAIAFMFVFAAIVVGPFRERPPKQLEEIDVIVEELPDPTTCKSCNSAQPIGVAAWRCWCCRSLLPGAIVPAQPTLAASPDSCPRCGRALSRWGSDHCYGCGEVFETPRGAA